jgi:type IV secretory pathway ATPase VirB11/archaellum biosynthesis ATPase
MTEVMVNGPDDVYVERVGRLERAPDGLFEGEESVRHLIERIVGPLGLRVDESSPWADARLPDGSRVHAYNQTCSSKGMSSRDGTQPESEVRARDEWLAAHHLPTRMEDLSLADAVHSPETTKA